MISSQRQIRYPVRRETIYLCSCDRHDFRELQDARVMRCISQTLNAAPRTSCLCLAKTASQLLLALCLPVCIFAHMSTQSSPQMRQCVFQVTPRNYNKYATEGNVSGSAQHCKSTQCCVAYGAVVNGQPKVDVLGEKGQKL